MTVVYSKYNYITGHNQTDELQWRNERTLYKNMPVTLYSQKGYVFWVWEASWRREQTASYWPKVLLTIAALLSRPGWAAQPWVTSPQSASWFSRLSPTDSYCSWNSNWLKPSVAPGYIIVWHPSASCGRTHLHRIQQRPQVKVIFRYLRPDAPVSLFFRLSTQVHLLIDGSVEGQCYIWY